MSITPEYPGNFTTGMGDAPCRKPFPGLTVYGPDRSVRTFVEDSEGNLRLETDYFKFDLPRVGVDGLFTLISQIRQEQLQKYS
jgi:hypothetical protein